MGKRNDTTWLGTAALTARVSACRVRVGCCATNRNYAWNVDKTHPAIKKYGYPAHSNLHAELSLALHSDLSGQTVYVARLNKAGKMALAKPCKHCMTVLIHVGVKRVVWTVDDDNFGEVKL